MLTQIKKTFSLLNFIMVMAGAISQVGCQSLGSSEKVGDQAHSAQINWRLKKNWVRELPKKETLAFRKSHRGEPLILGDILVESNGLDGVTAYNSNSGGLLWRFDVPEGVEAGVVASQSGGERLFFGGSDGYFYALDARSGHLIWRVPIRTEMLSTPVVDSDVIYFQSALNMIYALRASNGEQLWTYARQSPSELSIRGSSAPTLDQKRLYVGFSDGFFVALDRSTGKPIWETLLNRNKRFRDVDARAVLDSTDLFVSGYDDHLYSLDAETGKIRWKMKGGAFHRVTLYKDRIFLPTSQSEVLALNRNSGQKLWSYSVKHGISTAVQVYKNLLIFGESQGDLVVLKSETGELLTSFTPGKGLVGTPAIEPKTSRVYFVSGEANLYSLTLQNQPELHFDF